ncbi:ATP-binding protein [Streptosporangium sp. NPDC004631]
MGRLARPGRRSAPVPDPDSILGSFAQALRDLRDQVGDPSYKALARETERLGFPYSETSLRNATAGRAQPSWEVVNAFIRACVAFAQAHPHRANEKARNWNVQELLDTWATRWREMAVSSEREALDETFGSAVLPDGTFGERVDVPGNLPAALNGFVGREPELAEGVRLMSTTRLVTLTGTGGVGKTRLALRLAEQTTDRFPDGVWLMELAGLTDRAVINSAVAAVIGIQLNADREPLETMAEALGDQRVLLVLDNCEHLLDVTATLARSLLRLAPNLRILATSRQPLNVAGEHVLTVGPLPLPEEDGTDSAAMYLFADRARAALPGFCLTEENRAAVARGCRLLEGLPLALELAARRLRVLSLDDLLDRLGQRFLLLGPAGSERTAHPRHRTLRAVFDWSYELCSTDEQRVWERLSVFTGSVSLSDAETVCADRQLGPHAAFEALAGLVDKSLLRRVEAQGRTRLHMLETVRLYGQERLAASGQEAEARRRHRDHYLELARQAEEGYATPHQQEWLLRLTREHTNLLQTFTYALAEDAADKDEAAGPLLEGVYALWLYWAASGKVGEGAHWMRRISERYSAPPTADLSADWCRAQWCAAFTRTLHGDRHGAEHVLDRVEPVIQSEGDEWIGIHAAVHQLRGLCALFTGDLERVERHSRAALRAGGHRSGMITGQQALAQLGLVASMRGSRQEALACFQQALELSEGCGEIWHRSYLLWALAVECIETDQTGEAITLLRRSLDLKWRLGDRLGAATVSETLAWALAQCGQPRLAALILGAAHIAWQPAGAPQLWGFAHLMESRDRSITQIRRMLGDGPFQEEYRTGERRGLTLVLNEVFEEPAAGS